MWRLAQWGSRNTWDQSSKWPTGRSISMSLLPFFCKPAPFFPYRVLVPPGRKMAFNAPHFHIGSSIPYKETGLIISQCQIQNPREEHLCKVPPTNEVWLGRHRIKWALPVQWYRYICWRRASSSQNVIGPEWQSAYTLVDRLQSKRHWDEKVFNHPIPDKCSHGIKEKGW